MFKKKLLLSLLSLTLGASLIAGNVVYASGNPAESHDSTSPTRRVQDMEYSDSNNTISFYSADAGTGHSSCSECQKQVYVQEQNKHQVSHKVHHTHKGHHAKNQTKSHR